MLYFQEEIKKVIQQQYTDLEVIFSASPNVETGHLSIPCFSFSKILRRSSKDIADDLSELIQSLDFIDKVEFFVADLPLVNSKGDKIDAVERKDILINALNPKPPTSTQTITLYFPSLEDQKLHKELREIRVNNNTPVEEYVMAELIKGPTTDGLVRILPADTKVSDIKTQDGVCQIDLSYDLQVTHTENLIDKNLIIYSIVNSLTDLSRIQKVLFLKEGKKQTEFNIATQSGGVFERNEAFILQNP